MPPKSSPKSDPVTLLDAWGRRNNRKISEGICDDCGNAFRRRSESSRYCSRRCAWNHNGGHNKKLESWWTNPRGYIEGRIWEKGKQRYVKQHRYYIEKHIGRKLRSDEDVHHKNGVKSDNRISNLEVVGHGEHSKITNSEREYRKGYQLNLSVQERAARSLRMKEMRAIAKAEGREVPHA